LESYNNAPDWEACAFNDGVGDLEEVFSSCIVIVEEFENGIPFGEWMKKVMD